MVRVPRSCRPGHGHDAVGPRGRGIKEAKTGHTLGRLTMQLFYATDFIDRVENEMLPALRAGFVVLTDRYLYSAMARAEVRGIDSAWIRSIYSMALVPDAVFYLRINSPQQLVERVLKSGRGFDYWESGMDIRLGKDLYDSFVEYQKRMLKVFDRMGDEYGFHVLNASRSVRSVAADLRRSVGSLLDQHNGKEAMRKKSRDRHALLRPTEVKQT